jgi:hypothetical protein
MRALGPFDESQKVPPRLIEWARPARQRPGRRGHGDRGDHRRCRERGGVNSKAGDPPGGVRTFGFEQVDDALDDLATGQVTGAAVVRVRPE